MITGHPKYAILCYSHAKMQYEIVHYSHNFDDVQTQMLKHQDCSLMVNYEEVRTKDQRDRVKATIEQIIEAIRRKQSK